MKLLVPAILFVLCSAALSADESFAEDPQHTTTEIPTPRTTPSIVPPTDTTVIPTTTKEPPVTTETTHTPTVSPTTETTHTPTVSPTTEISTSTGVPTTTEAPTTKCTFNVTKGNKTCIKAEITAEFDIEIMGEGTKKVPLYCDSLWERSDCFLSNETQTLVLVKPDLYVLTMIFETDGETVSLSNVSLAYTLPNKSDEVANNSGNLIKMKAGNSYMCKSEIDIPLQHNVTMKVTDLHVQAFMEKEDKFGKVEECEADDKVSDIVPIAVGVALGALIIIVLIAYLVGRRRSRQKGYQSV